MLSVKVYTLTNGLRVVWYPDPTHSIYMTLTTRGGSRFERFEELGISHVLEHLCVRNPNLHREMELLGDGLANAETDLEDISYFFSFPPRNLLKGRSAWPPGFPGRCSSIPACSRRACPGRAPTPRSGRRRRPGRWHRAGG